MMGFLPKNRKVKDQNELLAPKLNGLSENDELLGKNVLSKNDELAAQILKGLRENNKLLT